MNEFLAGYYGTGANGGSDDADALEKMAQLTLLVKEAEENDIDISSLSDEEAMQLAEELYGSDGGDDGSDAGEQTGEEDLEKEAQAKFEEADFLGRVMAHSMWQELDNIQKEAAGVGEAIRGAASKVRAATTGRVGEAVAKRLRKGGLGETGKRIVHAVGGGVRKGSRTGKTYAAGSKRLAGAAEVGTAAAGLGAAGGAGYGAYKGIKHLRGKNKEGSALNSLIEQRAIEHLAAAGYVDQQGNVYAPADVEKTAADNDFNMMVDKAALELLEQNGYPVQWR